MSEELARYEAEKPLTVAEVKGQVQRIQEIMASVMVKDVHYGTIPGTPKPTLYKPGSEKILSTFHIGVDPREEITDISGPDEIRYRVAVKGFYQPTGRLLGVGVGECSSGEEKYKWRKPVCDQEFNETQEDRRRIVWKKGTPPYQQKQIRMNPADIANTVLKMAKKRAQIDMTLTVTAASDIFEQDIEDLPEGMEIQVNGKPPIQEPKKKMAEEPAIKGKKLLTLVNKVTVQRKNKDGVEMKSPLYSILGHLDGNETSFKTFDKTFADLAASEAGTGVMVAIEYETDKYGHKALTVEIPSRERTPGEDG